MCAWLPGVRVHEVTVDHGRSGHSHGAIIENVSGTRSIGSHCGEGRVQGSLASVFINNWSFFIRSWNFQNAMCVVWAHSRHTNRYSKPNSLAHTAFKAANQSHLSGALSILFNWHKYLSYPFRKPWIGCWKGLTSFSNPRWLCVWVGFRLFSQTHVNSISSWLLYL